VSTRVPSPTPPPGSVYAQMWMAELSDAQRADLPAPYHRPYFDSLSEPPGWICEACWSDGCTTAWPCSVASGRDGGRELAAAVGLGCSW
jgi:hypothetical protein